jgi:hypothetical protein
MAVYVAHVGAAPCGRPSPATIAPQQGAHAGAPLQQPIGRRSAGHGVHRSDSIHRQDAEAQGGRVRQSLPRLPSFSASLRLCGESSAAAAGHGVHRSIRHHLRSSVSICGSQPPPAHA